jgi:hypothetical protein
VSRWDEATRSLSRKVLEQVVRLGTPETNWWTTSSRVSYELRTDPVELYNAVRLLVEEGDVESKALDHKAVRATLRGWMKYPERGYENTPSRPKRRQPRTITSFDVRV